MNMSPEMQYQFIKNCYYNCNGVDEKCSYYKGQKQILPNDPCITYLIIEQDELKVKYNSKYLTYPLDRIIKESGYRQ